MKEIIDLLFHLKGSHTAVARALGYTGRQYRNIRKKVENGERLHPRVETFLLVKSQMIRGNSRTGLDPSSTPTGDATTILATR